MPLKDTKLRPGDPAPDLFLTAVNGVDISLRACLVEGPALVEFIRGTWCPSARARLNDLAAARGRLREIELRVLVVVCEDPFTVGRYFEAHPSPLTVLLDPVRRAARDFGVHQRWAWFARNLARPASFLIDRAGFVRFVYVARLPIEAAPVDAIVATLAAIDEENLRRRRR